jgi:hypothetical protein
LQHKTHTAEIPRTHDEFGQWNAHSIFLYEIIILCFLVHATKVYI